MPLDAAMVHCLAHELHTTYRDARVERIVQPNKDEIILFLHKNRENTRLLLNAGANYPRVALQQTPKENPIVAPMFCMLLRKHLMGAKLSSVSQLAFERVLRFSFEAYDEMGFPCQKHLILELMGRYSNLIFCDDTDKIYSALRLVDFTTSQKRQILPGMRYENPPPQDRRNPLLETKASFLALIQEQNPIDPLNFLQKNYNGLARYTMQQIACHSSDLDFWHGFSIKMESLRENTARPYLVLEETGYPVEYTFFKPQLLPGQTLQLCDSFCALLSAFYEVRAKIEQIKQRGATLSRVVSNAVARLQKKITLQAEELAQTADQKTWKQYADAITSQMYAVKMGMESVPLWCYETEEPTSLTVPLQKNLTPAQNAQRYYKRYRKAKTAEQILTQQIEKAEEELSYLQTVSDSLLRAETESDFAQIRAELEKTGYLFLQKNAKTAQKLPMAKPLKFRTDGGFFVLCGKNNHQNDLITTKIGQKEDLWFHIKHMPGAHVLLQTDDMTPSEEDILQATVIAATYSSADPQSKVEIDYTPLRYVKKPNGAKPGFVIYMQNRTAYVQADQKLCDRLRVE